jgi:hypothetical protein
MEAAAMRQFSRVRRFLGLVPFLAMIACASSQKVEAPTAPPHTVPSPRPPQGSVPSPTDGVPVEKVVASIQKALVDPDTLRVLKDTRLKVQQVTLSLEVVKVQTGDVGIDVFVKAEGSTNVTSTTIVTIHLAPPPQKDNIRPALSDYLVGSRAEIEPILARTLGTEASSAGVFALADAVRVAARGSQLAFCGTPHLGSTEIDTEFDFSVTNTLGGGVDIKIGPVGVKGTVAGATENLQRAVLTFVPTKKMTLEDCQQQGILTK